MGNPSHDLNQRVIQAIAQLVESPGGCLFIRNEHNEYHAIADWNMSPLPEQTLSAEQQLCCFMENSQWIVDLQEYQQYPERYQSISFPQWLLNFPQGRLLVPLMHQRRLFGFILLAEPRTRFALNWEVNDILKIAGNQATTQLAQQQAANALMIARQFESVNRMSTFMVHDLKNLVAQLSLLLNNAERHKDNPEFQADMLETLELSVNKMKRLVEKLTNQADEQGNQRIELNELLHKVIRTKAGQAPLPALAQGTDKIPVYANTTTLERILGHLLQNAIEATPASGKIIVNLRKDYHQAEITISDSGHGMSEQFIRERLFKPFESTKTAGMGIGVFESMEYVKSLGGNITVKHNQPTGSIFIIQLPIYQTTDE